MLTKWKWHIPEEPLAAQYNWRQGPLLGRGPAVEKPWSKARTAFARSNTGIVGSNPTWGMDVCVPLFCVCSVLCVQVAALPRADLPSKES
jgi:hypothetical protein